MKYKSGQQKEKQSPACKYICPEGHIGLIRLQRSEHYSLLDHGVTSAKEEQKSLFVTKSQLVNAVGKVPT